MPVAVSTTTRPELLIATLATRLSEARHQAARTAGFAPKAAERAYALAVDAQLVASGLSADKAKLYRRLLIADMNRKGEGDDGIDSAPATSALYQRVVAAG